MGLREAPDVQPLLARVQSLRIPDTPRRRRGTDTAFRSALSELQAGVADICRPGNGTGADGSGEETRYLRVDLPIELASLLFAAGAPHPEWRSWAARAASGLLDDGEIRSACVWAVLARDESLIARLPAASEPGTRPGDVVWWLATCGPQGPAVRVSEASPHTAPDESVDSAWAALVHSVPAGDRITTGRALRRIADFWLDEDEDWEDFHPHSSPDFEPELNAAVALAARGGWQPTDWPPDAVRFLEAGLAPGPSS